MTDADRLREIAGDISATNNAEDASRAAALWDIADRLEKREAKIRDLAEWCGEAQRMYESRNDGGPAECFAQVSARLHAMKEPKREAFTKAAEEYYTNPNAVTYRVLVATYNAMKEAEK